VDGEHTGSKAITELVGTWRPRVAVGRRGSHALIDTHGSRLLIFRTIAPQPVTGLELLSTADVVPISIFYVAFRLICTDCLLIE